MTLRPSLLAAGLTILCTPAMALDALTFGDFALTLGGGLNLTRARDGDTTSNAYGYLESTLTFSHTVGALTFGAEAYSTIEYDSGTEGRNLAVYDDPLVDLGVWVKSDSFGYLSYSYESSAAGEFCIEAPSSGDNFDHADYVTNGTCPSFDTRSVLYYRSPVFAGGFSIAASYMPKTPFESVNAAEAETSVSLALGYDGKDPSGASLTGSASIERVLSVRGGGPDVTAWQFGISRAKDGWTLGAAAAYINNGDGSSERAIGVSVLRQVNEKLSISAGLNASHSGLDGGDLQETSLSVIGLYQIVPDKVMVDAGLWQIRTDTAGVQSDRTVVGMGISLYF